MARNAVETLMGVVVLTVATGFGVFVYNSSEVNQSNQYELTARFDSVDGIGTGSDIRIGGVKVGVVQGLHLDPKTYQAVIELGIQPEIQLPEDTTVAIVSAGLLGSKYVNLSPGGSDTMLKEGDEISYTQSSVNLEELIGKFMFSSDGEKASGASASPSASQHNTASDSLGLGLE